jgi:hypothetical protein
MLFGETFMNNTTRHRLIFYYHKSLRDTIRETQSSIQNQKEKELTRYCLHFTLFESPCKKKTPTMIA